MYTSRVFPADRPTKAQARRDAQAVAEDWTAGGRSAWRVRATSQLGRPCVTVRSQRAGDHRLVVAWVERHPALDRLIVASHNAAAARALAVR